MQLRRYLFENKIKVNAFAKKLNYANQTIYSVINGKQKAGKKLAKMIEEITQGAVTAEEVIYESQANLSEEKTTEQFLLFK